MNNIGETIAALRKKRGLTQEALASLIGVSAQSVSKWENNTNMPDISLLPVIADLFGCRIDDLFGRGGAVRTEKPEQVLGNCCQAVLDEISACMYGSEPYEEYQQKTADYKKALKESDRLRTTVMCARGVVYYREKLGALLMKRPEDGWQSLLEKEEAAAVLTLLGNRDFRKALAEICRSHTFSFTPSSLCSRCGIQDGAKLEELLKESGLFWTKTLDVDGCQITIYEAANERKLAMLFAVLGYAAEYVEYEDNYTGFYGCGVEGLL